MVHTIGRTIDRSQWCSQWCATIEGTDRVCRCPGRSFLLALLRTTVHPASQLALALNISVTLGAKLTHQPLHLLAVKGRDLANLGIRETRFAAAGPLHEDAEDAGFGRFPVEPSVALRVPSSRQPPVQLGAQRPVGPPTRAAAFEVAEGALHLTEHVTDAG